MAVVDQNELHQRIGYPGDQSGWYVNNQQVVGGPPLQGQGNYAVQQGYGPNTYGPYKGQDLGPGEYVDRYGHVRYQGQDLGPGEYVDRYGHVRYQGQDLGPGEYVDRYGHVRRRIRGARLAACLALCWCITWPCHGPCCCGL